MTEPDERGAAPGDRPPAAGRSLLDWPREAGVIDAVVRELDGRRLRRRRARVAAGTGLLVAALVAGFLWRAQSEPVADAPEATPAVAVAASGARQMVLSDGSWVELKDGADLTVEFSDRLRRIVLKRGTAHFQVAKNSARPFVVAVAGIEVRAVGTAFSVQLAARKIEVLVTEGRVQVDQPVEEIGGSAPSPPSPIAMMDAGDAFVLDLATETVAVPLVRTVTAAEIDDQLAWRAPKLEFSATPLAEALAMVNRHSRRRLVLAEPALGRLSISGILRADNTTALTQLLASEFGIVAEHRGDDEIVLRAGR